MKTKSLRLLKQCHPRVKRYSLDLSARGFRLDLSKHTHIMGIVNVTPDSFSDGGKYYTVQQAVDRAIKLVEAGADIIDIGGESTRPFSCEVTRVEEISRVVPVIRQLAKKIKIPISIDTRKAAVACESIRAGAVIVNDVSGLMYDREMAGVVASHKAGLIIGHMRGTPSGMQINPKYKDVVSEVIADLSRSIGSARKAGISKQKIVIDPGIGFGKTAQHNVSILNHLDEFMSLGFPVCIGTSRKAFIGKILDLPKIDDRLIGTLATSVIAIMRGASIIRVHDIEVAVQAARMTDSVIKERLAP